MYTNTGFFKAAESMTKLASVPYRIEQKIGLWGGPQAGKIEGSAVLIKYLREISEITRFSL